MGEFRVRGESGNFPQFWESSGHHSYGFKSGVSGISVWGGRNKGVSRLFLMFWEIFVNVRCTGSTGPRERVITNSHNSVSLFNTIIF